MLELHDAYTFLYASAAALSVGVAVAAWRRRIARGALPLAVLMLGVAIWAAAIGMTWRVVPFAEQVLWTRFAALGVWMVPVAVVMIAADIANKRKWLTARRVVPLAIVSFALNNIEWVNPGNLYDEGFTATTVGTFVHYSAIPGPLYWAFSVFAFGAMGIGLAVLAGHALSSAGAERRQAAVLFFGGLLPFAGGLIAEAKAVQLALHGLEFAPLAFLATGVAWSTAVARGTLLDVIPVASETLIEQMPDGVVVLDAGSRVVRANPAALSILGISNAVGHSAEKVFKSIEGGVADLDSSVPLRAVLPCGNGESRFVEFWMVPLAAGSGGTPARLVMLRDVTKDRRARDRLELARTVFDGSNDGIVVLEQGMGDRISEVNDTCCRLSRRTREELVGKSVAELRSDRHPAEYFRAMEESLATTGRWEGEVWHTRGDGTEFPSWMSLSVSQDDVAAKARVVASFRDISEEKEADRLRHGATHDSLTGLANREVLDDRLTHVIAHVRRRGRPVAVLFIDLDNFKEVNDTMGHARGDEVLAEAGRRIASALRGSDMAARPGGDEFVVITDAVTPAMIEAEARRLRKVLAAPYKLDGAEVYVTASIGIAMYPLDGEDVGSLIQHADIAMYGAKRLGRDRVQFFSQELQDGLNGRVEVEKELIDGLEHERCFLLYEPQVDLCTGRVVGAETLVHLRAEDGTVASQTEFMAAAEYSDAVVALGEWALRRACGEVATLTADAEFVVSISLSARQLRQLKPAQLNEAMRTCGLEPQRLALGVTQTAYLGDPEEVVARLDELREYAGVRLLVNDFGTVRRPAEFTSLLPGGIVKLDRELVGRLPADAEARALVQSTIALAQGLGAVVVADGPETEEQIAFLRSSGCDAAQGFFFGYPVTAGELSTRLAAEPVHVGGLPRGNGADREPDQSARHLL